MIERKLVRTQQAQYLRGSIKYNKPYVFTLQATERKNKISFSYFEIEGDERPTIAEAKQSAWANAKAFLAEIGEVVKRENEYVSRGDE